MGRYASETTVPVVRSRAEIEETVMRYGASRFTSMIDTHVAMIGFRLEDAGFYIKFVLPIPDRMDQKFWVCVRHGREAERTEQQAQKEWEQEVRQRWRALLLSIKGKLEAVESGISTVEQEFLSFIVIPNSDQTVGSWLASEALPQIRNNQQPQLGYKEPTT